MMARARYVRRFATPMLAVALLAGTPLIGGCSKDKLVATEVPAEGVQLKYDLTPGATFTGRIFRRETVSERGQNITRSLTFTVQMRVVELEEDGATRVAAKVTNLDLNWNLNPNSPISLNEFIDRATKKIDGATIPFSVEPNGEVKKIPPAPEELDDNERQVLNAVTEGLVTAFYVVPDRGLKRGESWTESSERGKQGRLGKYRKTNANYTFEGLFTDPVNPDLGRLAKLLVETDRTEETKTRDSTHASRIHSKDTVLFSVDGNHLAKTSGTTTKFTGPTTVTTKFNAEWNPASKVQEAPVEEEPKAEKQVIDDPCDDDYVGSEDCTDPCSSNYLGEDPCEANAEGGDAPAEGDADAEEPPGEGGGGAAP